MQAAVFWPSTATNPLGMLVASGDARVVCSVHVSLDVSLACGTGRPCRATLGCLGCDASAHDHHRRAAARALQFGAFAQWWLHRCP